MTSFPALKGGPRRRAPQRKAPWMTRREVALQCFDATCPEVAVARLRRWIRGDPQMLADLRATGYRDGLHRFPPRMVRVFRKYIL